MNDRNLESLNESSADSNTVSVTDIKAFLEKDMQDNKADLSQALGCEGATVIEDHSKVRIKYIERLLAFIEPKPRTAFDIARQVLERFDATSTDEIVRAAQNSAAASMIVEALRNEGYKI